MKDKTRNRWKIKSSKILFKNKWIKIIEDRISLGKNTYVYTRLLESNHVVIIPYEKPASIYMINNYRYIINKISLELPAGHIEKNESIKLAAERELLEETGLRNPTLTEIGWFYLNESRSTSKVFTLLATDFQITSQQTDKLEKISVKKFSIYEVFKLLDQGKIKHSPTIIALHLLKERMKYVQKT